MTTWLLYPPNPNTPKPRVTARRCHVLRVHADRCAATVEVVFLGQRIAVEAPFARLARGREKFRARWAAMQEAAQTSVPAVRAHGATAAPAHRVTVPRA